MALSAPSTPLPCPRWPQGRRFAFAIIDDTDEATVENVGPVYSFLRDEGFAATKTVWPLAPSRKPVTGGESLESPHYRQWVLSLQHQGFEIAYHGATDHTSPRERVLQALDRYREVIGQDPSVHTAHTGQREAMYWGSERLDGLARALYWPPNFVRRRSARYLGHVEASPYFWGDLCRERITYVRNLVFREVNTLHCDPLMPYHDPRRPYVRFWFSASEGATIRSFVKLLREANQDKLAEEGGACIVYTHLARGFCSEGELSPDFVRLMRRLARLGGWYTTASELLDHLRSQPGWTGKCDPATLRRMQWSWLLSKLTHGRS